MKYRTNRTRIGFTLSEVLIAVGILGIGLTMASTLFPAAIKLNQNSVNDSIGMRICENGLTLAKAMLDKDDVTSTDLAIVADELIDTTIPKLDQHYPGGTEDTDLVAGQRMRGFVLLGREDGGNHHLAAVSYTRAKDHTVEAREITGVAIDEDPTDAERDILSAIAAAELAYLKLDGLVIATIDAGSQDATKYARIVGFGTDTVIVQPRLLPAGTASDTGKTIWTLVDIPAPGIIGNKCPAMAVMTMQTRLPEPP